MRYYTKYKNIENAIADFSTAATAFSGYTNRLNNVKSALGSFPSFQNYRSSVNERSSMLSTISKSSTNVGKCLENIRIGYISAEQLSHRSLSKTVERKVGKGLNVKSFIVSRIKNRIITAYKIGIGAVKTTKKVTSKIRGWIGPGGRYEGAWKAVTSTTKLITGAVLLATSVATGNPLGVIYGANMLINAGADLYNIDKKRYDKVGKTNVLKKVMVTGGEMKGAVAGTAIGYVIGGKEGAKTGAKIGKSVGSKVGSVAYHAGEIYAVASVGKTVVKSKPGNINNALSVKGHDYTTIKELTKLPNSYKYTKEAIDFVDAVAKDEVASYATGKIISGASKELSSVNYGKHGLSEDAMKEVLKNPSSAIETDVVGLIDEVARKGASEIGKAASKPNAPIKSP